MTSADLADENFRKDQEVWKIPLDTKRTHTDLPFFVAFIVFVILWLIMGLYVFFVDDTLETFYTKELHQNVMSGASTTLDEIFYDARWPILGFILLAVLSLAVFIAMFRWLTKILIFLTIVVTPIITMLYYLLNIWVYNVTIDFLHMLIISIVGILYGVILRALKKLGTEPVCKVIRMSCKAMFFFPSTVLVSLVQFFINLFVIGFAMTVFLLLKTVNIAENLDNLNMTEIHVQESKEMWNETDANIMDQIRQVGLTSEQVIVFQMINLIGLFWIYDFFAGLERMILTATFATWYYTEDKSRLSVLTTPKCIIIIIRHHLGTVAYGSSLFTIFPMIYIVFKHGREKLKEIYKKPSCVLAWLTVLAKFSFDALATCAVHGSTFYKSAKDSYILSMKNPLSFLTINFISECVILIGVLLLPVMSFFSSLAYVCSSGQCYSEVKSADLTLINVVTLASLLMSLTFFSVFRAASNTIRYCYLQDSKFNHEAEMDMYEVYVEDSAIKV